MRPVFERTLNTVDAANTPEKFFSLMRVRKRIFRHGFLCVCFSFSFSTFCVSVSLAENEIVERNPLEYPARDDDEGEKKVNGTVCVALKYF